MLKPRPKANALRFGFGEHVNLPTFKEGLEANVVIECLLHGAACQVLCAVGLTKHADKLVFVVANDKPSKCGAIGQP